MSFSPVWGPELSSHAYIRSSVSAYLASLAALCSSIVARIFTFVDKLAMRIPPSCCIFCQFERMYRNPRAWYLKTEKKTTALVYYPGTEVYALERLENIDGESNVQLVQFCIWIPVFTAHIVEKAIYRKFLPSSAQSIKVQLPGEKKFLAEVRIDGAGRRRGLKYQQSLVDGFYIMPARAGTQTTMDTNDAREDHLAELPTPSLSNQDKSPVELLTNETVPVPAPPVPLTRVQPASPTPILLSPRPRSPKTRKASPLLPPPPMDRISEKRTSLGSSVGSASIQIAYQPSHHEDAGKEKPKPLKASTPVH